MPRNDALMPELNQWGDIFHDLMSEIYRLRKLKKRYMEEKDKDMELAEIQTLLNAAPEILARHNVQRMKVLLNTMKEI